MPVLTGYMLSRVPPALRTTANSVANVFYNLLGFFPAPSIYGIVYQMHGSGDNHWGLAAIQMFGLTSIIFMAPSVAVSRCRDNRAIKKLSESPTKELHS